MEVDGDELDDVGCVGGIRSDEAGIGLSGVGALIGIRQVMLAIVFRPVGDLILRRKGGLFKGFLLGAFLWRLGIWLIPFVGALIYLEGLIWGPGGWVLAAWRLRRTRPVEREVLPEAPVVRTDDTPEDWEYPLAPEIQ